MPTVKELGLLAEAVYEPTCTSVAGWSRVKFVAASGSRNGFQAATYQQGTQKVVAFRGTAQAMDGVADLKLGTGMNSTYFSDGDDYVEEHLKDQQVFLCGHSLGGAIAQVVANRGRFKFATFNAPGVAVFASRNIATATEFASTVRTFGMLASVVRHPVQAVQDVKAAFNIAHGLNVCLACDAVSQIGLHYGRVERIQSTSYNPVTEHKIATVNKVLADHNVGKLLVESF